jgi:electron transfer flavoprotein beta subunit
MNIIVLAKHVVDTAALRIDPKTGPVFRGALTKVSDYDKHAVEEAVRIKEKTGAKVTILCVGPTEAARTSLKEAVAMGADEAFLVSTGSSYVFNNMLTLMALINSIKRIGSYDLIICGEVSEDLYQAYIGPALAVQLGIPFIGSAVKMEVNAGKIRVERKLEDVVEVLESPLPAIISVTREINQPRIPTTMQIMKVPLTKIKTIAPGELGLSEVKDKEDDISVLEKLEPARMASRKGIKVEGAPEEVAEKLIDALKKEGVLE